MIVDVDSSNCKSLQTLLDEGILNPLEFEREKNIIFELHGHHHRDLLPSPPGIRVVLDYRESDKVIEKGRNRQIDREREGSRQIDKERESITDR